MLRPVLAQPVSSDGVSVVAAEFWSIPRGKKPARSRSPRSWHGTGRSEDAGEPEQGRGGGAAREGAGCPRLQPHPPSSDALLLPYPLAKLRSQGGHREAWRTAPTHPGSARQPRMRIPRTSPRAGGKDPHTQRRATRGASLQVSQWAG